MISPSTPNMAISLSESNAADGGIAEHGAAVPGEAAVHRLSMVIPCLNEAENIERCVTAAFATMERADISGEVIVADNGSEDGSAELAAMAGARVIHEPMRGYGRAYLAGFGAAQGTYIVMADADLTYDFNEIPRFLAELEAGADMIIGDRMKNIHPGAMPWHHRYIGNPLLSGLLNLLFHTGVSDAHCGMRAFRRDRLERLALRATGMEFASEMVIRAAQERLDIRQLQIEYMPRGDRSCRASGTAGGICASCCSTRRPICSSCPVRWCRFLALSFRSPT